jgi:hypothetical protein
MLSRGNDGGEQRRVLIARRRILSGGDSKALMARDFDLLVEQAGNIAMRRMRRRNAACRDCGSAWVEETFR